MGSIAISRSPDRVHVIGSVHPLRNQLRQIEVPAGLTIDEVLDLALMDASLDWPRDAIVASVGDTRIPRSYWRHVKPKVGQVVIFRPVARNDKFLRTALMIAVAIAASIVAPIIGTAIGGFFATSAGIALIGGALTIGASLLVNALIPIRPPQINSAAEGGGPKSLPMVGGAQNESRPWETVPVILGRHRISPFYAARPYTFFSGQKQFVNMLFCVGYGRLALTQIKIGETPIAQFEEVDTQLREGAIDDDPTNLFPVISTELPLAVTLKLTDGFSTRRSSTNTDQLSVDLIAPSGIFRYDHLTGAYVDRPVTINVQYRKVGDSDWTSRPDIVFKRTRDTHRRGDRWDVDRGQYDVRLQKATAEYTGVDQVAEEVQWITLRSIQHGHPIAFPKPLAVVAIRIRANDQLNGVINTFNLVAESYVKGFNGTSWVDDSLSRNNADLFRHVLQGPANARPRSDAQIDLDSIEDWWADCVANDYSYNAVQSDRRTVREVLADIAAAGRATVALRNGKWGVSFPRSTDTTSWHFTPRNFSGFKTERIYRDLPHALRVRFINQDRGWREDERVVYSDGYDVSNATVFEQIETPGVTRAKNVWRHGRFFMAQALLRPESHTLNSDIESLRLERGDKVALSNDVLLIGTGYGRVAAIDADSQVVTVDSTVIMEIGKSYQIKFRLADGTSLTRVVFNTANETNDIQLDDTLSSTMPEAGDLFSFGETDLVTRDYRIIDARPGSDFASQFILVDDAPEIDDADSGEIPAYNPGVTKPPDPYTLTPQSITVSERLAGSGITTKSVAQVTVQIPRVGTIRAFEFQVKDIDIGGDWEPFAVVPAPHLVAERDNLEQGSWQFRVRSLFSSDGTSTNDNDFSAWVESSVYQLLGIFAPPDDVTDLVVSTLGDVSRITWSPVSAVNFAYYLIKFASVTDGSATWGGSLEVQSTVTNYADVPARIGTYSIKAVTFAQVESVNPTFSITSVAAATEPNVVSVLTEDPTFAGVLTDLQVIIGDILTLDTVSGGGLYITSGFYEFANLIDLGASYTSRIEAIITAAGVSIGDTMDTWTTLSSVTALDTTDPSQWSIQPYYAWTDDDPGGSPVVWSDWIPFTISNATGRALKFALGLTGSPDGRVSPGVVNLAASVDMPDRHLGFKDQQSGTAGGGFAISFSPPFKHLRDVTVSTTDLNTTAGEKYEILAKDETGVTIRFKNLAGTVVDRKFDLHAYGYGLQIM